MPTSAPANPSAPLAITGERTVPGVAPENYWFRRHEAVYRWLAADCGGGLVLDVGAGEGYGAALLAARAKRVVGMDYDEPTVAHARATYPDVRAVRGNATDLPFAEASVDVVVGLQVIEHLWDQAAFVREASRVLRPGGRIVVATPNRLTFSPDWEPGTPHANPFHSQELSADELVGLLAEELEVSDVLGVFHGPRLSELDAKFDGMARAQLAGPQEQWSAELAEAVASVTVDDFAVARDRRSSPADSALDLIAVANKPA